MAQRRATRNSLHRGDVLSSGPNSGAKKRRAESASAGSAIPGFLSVSSRTALEWNAPRPPAARETRVVQRSLAFGEYDLAIYRAGLPVPPYPRPRKDSSPVVIERWVVGGQAGSCPRIENDLGLTGRHQGTRSSRDA
jgi:hypothetical protein